MRSMMTKIAAGTMLAGSLALGGTNAFADHTPPFELPRLTSIQILREQAGRHQMICGGVVSLDTVGTGWNDHFTFEVRGLDQWGRPLMNCAVHPTLSFPAGSQVGWIEALGDNHFRFHAGAFETWNTPLWIGALENPAIRVQVLVTIQARWHHQVVAPGCGGTWGAPTYVAPAPVYPAPVGGVRFGHHDRNGGFWFGLDSNGGFSFGVRGR